MTYMIELRSPNLVERSDLWQRTVNKVLNEDQAEAFAELNEARETRLRDAAINFFVARVDFHTGLRNSQIKELRAKVADDPIADQLAERMIYRELSLENTGRRFSRIQDFKYNYLVEDILNERQLKKWNSIFEPELQNLPNEIRKLEIIMGIIEGPVIGERFK